MENEKFVESTHENNDQKEDKKFMFQKHLIETTLIKSNRNLVFFLSNFPENSKFINLYFLKNLKFKLKRANFPFWQN